MSDSGKKVSVSKNASKDEERCIKCQRILPPCAHHACTTWWKQSTKKKTGNSFSNDFELVSPFELERNPKTAKPLDIAIGYGKSTGTQTEPTVPSTSEKATQTETETVTEAVTETNFDLNENMSCEELVQILYDKVMQHRLLLTKLNHLCKNFAKKDNVFS